VCDLEDVVVSSILKVIRIDTTLTRMLPTLDLRVESRMSRDGNVTGWIE
jgi:hypothetical protein